MPSSDPEQRIRRLGYAIESLARDVAKAKDDAGALYQMLMAAASLAGKGNECPVTITGNVTTFAYGFNLAGASVEVWYPDNTGIQVGTTATTDGLGDYTINGSVPTGGVAATIYFSKVRFFDQIYGLSLGCGSATADGTLGAATGYHESEICTDPLSDNLTLVDAVLGTVTITYNPSTFQWEFTIVTGANPRSYEFCPPGITAEPGILVVSFYGPGGIGIFLPRTKSTSSTIGCAPLNYVASGPETDPSHTYPSGTGNWTITDP